MAERRAEQEIPEELLANPILAENIDRQRERAVRVQTLRNAIDGYFGGRDTVSTFLRPLEIDRGALLPFFEAVDTKGRPAYGREIKPPKKPISPELKGMSPEKVFFLEEQRMLAGCKNVRARRYSLREMGFGNMLDFLGMEDFGFLVMANVEDLQEKGKNEDWAKIIKTASNIIFWNAGWTSETGVWRTDPAAVVNERRGLVSIVVAPPGYGRNSWQQRKMDEVVEARLYTKRGLSFIMAVLEEMLDVRRKGDKRRIITVAHSQNAARILELPPKVLAQRNRVWLPIAPAGECKSFPLIGSYTTLEALLNIGGNVPSLMSKPITEFVLNQLTKNVDPETVAVHKAVVDNAINKGVMEGLSWAMHDLYDTRWSRVPIEHRENWPHNTIVFFGSEDPLVAHRSVIDYLIEAGFPLGRINVGSKTFNTVYVADRLGHYSLFQTAQKNLDTVQARAENKLANNTHDLINEVIRAFLKKPPSRKK